MRLKQLLSYNNKKLFSLYKTLVTMQNHPCLWFCITCPRSSPIFFIFNEITNLCLISDGPQIPISYFIHQLCTTPQNVSQNFGNLWTPFDGHNHRFPQNVRNHAWNLQCISHTKCIKTRTDSSNSSVFDWTPIERSCWTSVMWYCSIPLSIRVLWTPTRWQTILELVRSIVRKLLSTGIADFCWL